MFHLTLTEILFLVTGFSSGLGLDYTRAEVYFFSVRLPNDTRMYRASRKLIRRHNTRLRLRAGTPTADSA